MNPLDLLSWEERFYYLLREFALMEARAERAELAEAELVSGTKRHAAEVMAQAVKESEEKFRKFRFAAAPHTKTVKEQE